MTVNNSANWATKFIGVEESVKNMCTKKRSHNIFVGNKLVWFQLLGTRCEQNNHVCLFVWYICHFLISLSLKQKWNAIVFPVVEKVKEQRQKWEVGAFNKL